MKIFLVSVACIALLAACGKESHVAPDAPGSGVKSMTTMPAVQNNKSLPKGDTSRPLELYEPIDGGAMLLAMTHLDRPSGPNLQELASALSPAYSRETDGFKRQDLLQAIRPEIESLLLRARNQRYLVMEQPASYRVETYDFDSRTFGLQAFAEHFSSHYFHDHPSASFAFSNKADFRHLRVDDETVARRIESMRQRSGMTLRIYFYVSGYNSLRSTLEAQVMAVALVDQGGKPLAVQKGQ